MLKYIFVTKEMDRKHVTITYVVSISLPDGHVVIQDSDCKHYSIQNIFDMARIWQTTIAKLTKKFPDYALRLVE